MRDLAGQRAAVGGRLDELHVELAVADEGTQIAAQPLEGAHHRFERDTLLVGLLAQSHQRARGDVDRHGPRRTIVEARRPQRREERFQRQRVAVALVGERAGVIGGRPPRRTR